MVVRFGRIRLAAIIAVAVASALACAPGNAQQTGQPSIPGYYSTKNCSPGVSSCYQPQLTALAGTQRGVSIASATALTIPTGAILAVITVQGTNNSSGICAYWQDDGTDPTASAGQPLAALAGLTYYIRSLPIKVMAATGATCTLNVSYYG